MIADRLLPLLTAVTRTGPNRWTARCPAHDDQHPSLSVREAEDGRLLMHCWARCDVQSIVDALGLAMCDLFPERDPAPSAGHASERRPWNAASLIELAAFEAGVAVVVISDALHGREIGSEDLGRLAVAASRLADMREAVHGSH